MSEDEWLTYRIRGIPIYCCDETMVVECMHVNCKALVSFTIPLDSNECVPDLCMHRPPCVYCREHVYDARYCHK